MLTLPPITLRLRGWKLIDRVALAFLLLCSIALGAGCGLLFVYASDLPKFAHWKLTARTLSPKSTPTTANSPAASRCSAAS